MIHGVSWVVLATQLVFSTCGSLSTSDVMLAANRSQISLPASLSSTAHPGVS